MALGSFANRPLARSFVSFFLAIAVFPFTAHAAGAKKVAVWLTTRDKSSLLAEEASQLSFVKAAPGASAIVIDDHTHFQTMDGFGHSLTGGTAQLMMKMSPTARTALLKERFGRGPGQIGTS